MNDIEIENDDDIFITRDILPELIILPSYNILKFEVQDWTKDDNRERLKTICSTRRIPADIKRISPTSVRVILKHTNSNVLRECYAYIVTQVLSDGTVTSENWSQDFGTLAQGTLIHSSRGLVRSDGVDSLECESLSDRMSRWSSTL